jgi:hypothetical protein
MLKLPIAGSGMDPFESILRKELAIPSAESLSSELKEKEHPLKTNQATELIHKSQEEKPHHAFQAGRPRQGFSL